MSEEVRAFFWATTLDNNKAKETWDPERCLGPNGDVIRGDHRLTVKQALLGPEVYDNDVNMIEIETTGYKEQSVKFPIHLVQGKVTSPPLNIFFPNPPVTFRLVSGSGPVHLYGNHTIRMEEIDEEGVCRSNDTLGQEVEFVVVDEDGESEELEEMERNTRKENKRSIPQSNNTKIRKKVRDH